MLNADLIWINASATAHEATLTNSLNTIGVPALLVEMGLGNRVTRSFGDQITEGIFNLMHEIGIWSGPVGEIRNAKLTRDYGIDFSGRSPQVFSCRIWKTDSRYQRVI